MDSIRNINFIFELSKELDVYVDSIPKKIFLTAYDKILVRDYALACLLDAVCSGRGTFRLKSCVDEAISILELHGADSIGLTPNVLEGELIRLMEGVEETVLLSPAVLQAVSAVCLHAERSQLSLAGTLLSGTLDSIFAASGQISLSGSSEAGEFGLDLGTEHTLNVGWRPQNLEEIFSELPPLESASLAVRMAVGKLRSFAYRLFSECSQVNIQDLSSMTLEDFFYFEK